MLVLIWITTVVLLAFLVYCLKVLMTALLQLDETVNQLFTLVEMIQGHLEVIAKRDASETRVLRAENSNLRRRMGEYKEDDDVFPARQLPGLRFERKGGDNVAKE